MPDQDVMMYTLSTCSHCKSTKRLLDECSVEYDFVDVDLLDRDEREKVLEDVKKLNPKCSFPTIKIGDRIIVGYREEEIKDALGISDEMNAGKLYEQLKKAQEPKGYYFNRDSDLVMELLSSLLKNKQRYGYMACPCRLASGDREKDRDIICPCEYRGRDVDEYGSCYCGLYVSKDWNEDRIVHAYVPERRPPEKFE